MELEESNLRIGNYVNFGEIILTVSSIFRTHFNCDNAASGVNYGNSLQSKYSPTPLTKQWMFDLGYKVDNDDGDILFKDGVQILLYGGTFELFNHDFPKKIKWVHELQNIHYELSDRKLTK